MSQTQYGAAPLSGIDDSEDLALQDELADQEVDEIEVRRVEVENTRAEIGDTMDAIKDKLSPQSLAQQAKETAQDVTSQVMDSIHDATIGRAQDAMGRVVDRTKETMGGAMSTARNAGGSVVDAIRENPIPAAMIGLGIGWLLMSARSGGKHRSYENGYYADDGGQRDYRTGGYYGGATGYGATAGYDAQTAGDKADGVGARIGDAAGQVKERAGEMVDRVQEKAGQVAQSVQHGVGRLGSATQVQAGRAADTAQRWWSDNPLAVGALAVGAGLAVGLLVPESQAEHRWMGEKRDQLMDRAQDTAQQIGQKVQHVAQEAMTAAKDTAQQEAREQGLTAPGMGEPPAA